MFIFAALGKQAPNTAATPARECNPCIVQYSWESTVFDRTPERVTSSRAPLNSLVLNKVEGRLIYIYLTSRLCFCLLSPALSLFSYPSICRSPPRAVWCTVSRGHPHQRRRRQPPLIRQPMCPESLLALAPSSTFRLALSRDNFSPTRSSSLFVFLHFPFRLTLCSASLSHPKTRWPNFRKTALRVSYLHTIAPIYSAHSKLSFPFLPFSSDMPDISLLRIHYPQSHSSHTDTEKIHIPTVMFQILVYTFIHSTRTG